MTFAQQEAAVSLHIDDPEVVRMAEELARTTGETMTEAVRRALLERRARLRFRRRFPDPSRAERVRRCLESGFSRRAREAQLGRAQRLPNQDRAP